MVVAGLLQDRAALGQDLGLTLHLVAHSGGDAAEGVHVLRLGARTQGRLGRRAQRHVDVGAHVAALHAGLGHVQGAENVAQGLHVCGGHLGRALAGTLDRTGHDLHEGNARTVVIHERVIRALDATVCATDVRVLTRVLLHVRALNLHAEHGAVLELDVHVAVVSDRLVGLGGLEGLRQVRVEVVLTRETAVLRDLAVQGQADLDRVLDGLVVDDRQGAGQTQRHGGHEGVRVAAKRVGGRVEHLGLGAQLDVHLNAENRVEAACRLVVIHELSHHFSSQLAAGH